ASSKARELGSRTRRGAMHAREDFWESFMENPLVLGAAGLAVGALLGAMIPETDKEDELMGDTAQRVRNQVSEEVRERTDQVKHVAQAAAGAAKESGMEAARDQARREGLTGNGQDRSASGGQKNPLITNENRPV
ncbi:MAG: hypothetical protein LC732_11410, partial [Acidobacteria bacterium]|nr:hypothetical protein [Acidobacteriota bacterium]